MPMSSLKDALGGPSGEGSNVRADSESRFLSVPNDQELMTPPGRCLLILDSRALDRECLAKALVDSGLAMDVLAMASIEEWKRKKDILPPLGAILINVGGRRNDDPAFAGEIVKLTSEFKNVPVVILSDTDDPGQILRVLDCGARGYIPTSVGIAVCVEAIGLAVAGGIFIPASSFLAMKHLVTNVGAVETPSLSGMFTLRQEEVVQALRKGKANKIIAFELNLRESTVKVHIRNIMKKLKATNRTEVAYKLNTLYANMA
jgi:DNA-binding NarL/FixJ family response regulator